MKFTVINSDGTTTTRDTSGGSGGVNEVVLDAGQELDLRGMEVSDIAVDNGDVVLTFEDGSELRVDLPVDAAAVENAGVFLRLGGSALESQIDTDVSPASVNAVLEALSQQAIKLTVFTNDLGESDVGVSVVGADAPPISLGAANLVAQIGSQLALVSSFINPPALQDAVTSVAEGTANGSVVFDLNDRFTGADSDRDGQVMRYAIVAGNDDGVFAINGVTGQISVADGSQLDQVVAAQYELTVRATSGAESTTASVLIEVLAANDNVPQIVDVAAGPPGSNGLFVIATDADPESVFTFSIVGGPDQALMQIDANTGLLTLIDTPDFENPGDADGNNVYEVVVRVSDGLNVSSRTVTLAVTDRNDTAPQLPSDLTVSVLENSTVATTIAAVDPDSTGEVLEYQLIGGADAERFQLNSLTGVLTFVTPPDFENPSDADADNVYEVIVSVSDGENTSVQNLNVAVADFLEADIQFLSPGEVSINENTTAVLVVSAQDAAGAGGGAVSYSISGGPDAALFEIDENSGALRFIDPPDFEAPGAVGAIDAGSSTDGGGADIVTPSAALEPVLGLGDINLVAASIGNTYNVQVQATDSLGSAIQDIQVSVNDVNDNAPVFQSDSAVAVAENQGFVQAVLASDADGTQANNTVTYSITGGVDAELFSINADSGVLTFNASPDFERPGDLDGDNVYNLRVTASDGNPANAVFQDISITVTDAPDAPSITSDGGASTAFLSVLDDQTAVTDVNSIDDDGDVEGEGLTYSLSGGADSALFQIDAATGALAFQNPLDSREPIDANGDNEYEVQVLVTDSTGLTAAQDITVRIQRVNRVPAITSDGGGDVAQVNVSENTNLVTDLEAIDGDGDTEGAGLIYAIEGGVDAALFDIDPITGTLQFLSPPDFETPLDAGDGNNIYLVDVSVSDSVGAKGVQSLQVQVTDVNEVPIIISGNGDTDAFSIQENTFGPADPTAFDPEGEVEGQGLSYAISGGADAALFQINPDTGVYQFVSAPDFENPLDADADNVYELEISVTDSGGLSDSQRISITVTGVNESPEIVSDGGGAVANLTVVENTTAVIDLNAQDQESAEFEGLSYGITGGEDESLFSIDPNTGELSFANGPNFEVPLDANSDNVYRVQVTVTDSGGLTGVQDLLITVTNVNETPIIVSDGGGTVTELSVDENVINVTDVETFDEEDAEGAGLNYALSGGADVELFVIDPVTGALSFATAPDFEDPQDIGADNAYSVEVTVTDSGGLVAQQAISITVNDKQENPVIVSNGGGDTATLIISENTLGPNDVDAIDSDGDTEAAGLTYSLSGADAGEFTIDANTGVFQFVSPPNFEVPTDADENNEYELDVVVSDSDGLTDTQSFVVRVIDANDAPLIVSDGAGVTATVLAAENQTANTNVESVDEDGDVEGEGLTYALTGGADIQSFTIDSNTGALSFVTPRDFESPEDVGGDNVYNVQVTVTDSGGLTDVQDIAVIVTDVNEAPFIVSAEGAPLATFGVAENTVGTTDFDAIDPEGNTEGAGLTYALSGPDASFFSIDPKTGVFQFNTAPDFETPLDSNLDNRYDFVVTVSDSGGLTHSQAVQFVVTDVNETPVITSDGGGATASISIFENQTAITNVESVDEDGDVEGEGLTYALTGGADIQAFTIDSITGELSFVEPSDFESPGDVGGDNLYNVQVTVTDSGNLTDVQEIAVLVQDVNEAPVIISGGGGETDAFSISENTLGPSDVDAIDPEGDGETGPGGLVYSISGADSGLFTINATTGVFQFQNAPDFETRLDADENNVYEFTVTVADSGGLTDSQSISITVTDVNEGPVIISNGGGATAAFSVDENQLSVTDVQTSDPDDGEGNGLIYELIGGVDLEAFVIDTATGVLTFFSPPDFETPDDANGDNVYEVNLRVTDSGGLSDTQNLLISLNDVNEAPVITSGGGAELRQINILENTLGPDNVEAQDPEGDVEGEGLTYSLSGDDAALFSLDTNTGQFQFITAPDFEAPADVGADNTYQVIITVTDSGGLTDQQEFQINVLDEPSNIAPTNILPTEITTEIGEPFAISGLSVSDSDAGNSQIRTTFSVNQGTLTVSPEVIGGVTAANISGNGTATLTLLGMVNEINTTLADANGLSYIRATSHDFPTSGRDTLIVTTDDLGNTGEGGAQSSSNVAEITTNVVTLSAGEIPLEGFIGGLAEGDALGFSVSSAGDFNGDGLDDFILGAPQNGTETAAAGNGLAYVVFNQGDAINPINLAALDGINGFVITGANVNDRLGVSVTGIGDFNDDGFDDILVGADGVTFAGQTENFRAGESYVIFGTSDSIAAPVNVGNLTASEGFSLTSFTTNEGSGASVSGGGDINGDGLGDFIIGAPQAEFVAGVASGKAYVVFGDARSTANIDLRELVNGFTISGGEANAELGAQVALLGDVNGDGFDDVLVGAPGTDINGVGADVGAAYVIFGGPTLTGDINVAELSGVDGFRIDGVTAGDRLGESVSAGGDINGDGFEDILVGAPGRDGAAANQGVAYVIYGGTGIGASGVLSSGALDGTNGFALVGGAGADIAGAALSGIGDFNGDGFDDFLVGAPQADRGGAESGSSYVIFGSASGPGASFSLSDLNGENGFELFGAQGQDLSGNAVSGAGDINGDGFDDLLIGAVGADAGAIDSGGAYFLFGGDFRSTVTFFGDATDNTLFGDGENNTLIGAQGNDFLDGGAGDDILIGGAGDDLLLFDAQDTLRVDGGAGIDVLFFDAPVTLDLTAIDNGLYTGIETLALNEAPNTAVNLTIGVGDVLDMSDTNTLTIAGNAEDTLNLFGGSGDGSDDNNIQGSWVLTFQGEVQNVYAFFGSGEDILAGLFVDSTISVTGAIIPA